MIRVTNKNIRLLLCKKGLSLKKSIRYTAKTAAYKTGKIIFKDRIVSDIEK